MYGKGNSSPGPKTQPGRRAPPVDEAVSFPEGFLRESDYAAAPCATEATTMSITE